MKALQRFTQTEMKEHDHGEAFLAFLFYASDMDECKELDILWI
jgi:hypothetical protein